MMMKTSLNAKKWRPTIKCVLATPFTSFHTTKKNTQIDTLNSVRNAYARVSLHRINFIAVTHSKKMCNKIGTKIKLLQAKKRNIY